jgi:molecular chaperone HscB
MDIMDINEAVMELEFDFDQSAYNKAIQQMESLENSLDSQVTPLLDQYPGQNDQKATLEQIKDYYLKKRYLLRIQENLNKFAPQ